MVGRLQDKVILVTGGSGGLGEGIVSRLAADGARVVIADLRPPAETSANSGQEFVELDVTNSAQVEEVISGVAARHGRLDVVVNNAGIAQPIRDVIDTPNDVIDRVFAVNVRGIIAVIRVAGKIMRSQGHGRIINTASQAGKRAWPGWGVYSASKAAVIAITQATALELAPDVTVNAICPGTMLTDMTRTGFQAGAGEGESWEDNLARHAEAIPLKRLGTPDDIAKLVSFLASDDASFTTGAAINLTGGEEVFF